MTKINRHFARKKKIDDDELLRLWQTRLPDRIIAQKMGHSQGALRRRAIKLGLPSSRREIWAEQR